MRHLSASSSLSSITWRTGVATLALVAGTGCAALKDPNTYDKAANIACELLAQEKAEQAKLQGVSFEDVHKAVKAACDAKEEIQPWIDALLAASQEQGAAMGATMGVKQEK